MLLNNIKKFLVTFLVVMFSINCFAATTDLSTRFLDKANEAYENGNVDDAYKYVNQALAVAKDAKSSKEL